ncbi:MAG: Smr/MutS family protein [Acidobacteria bacterium]|nr:Smr/MutS family protein [Acidobacteriota bacterium]
MRFDIGDHVLVRSLGKGIVRELRNAGRYLIEIKGRSLLVDEQQLSPIENRKARPTSAAPEATLPELLTRSHAAASLDLHGMTTDEAVVALGTFLNDAILGGLPVVRVIHGRSGGRLKAAVHGRLKVLPSIRGFRLDPANPGVTIVTF